MEDEAKLTAATGSPVVLDNCCISKEGMCISANLFQIQIRVVLLRTCSTLKAHTHLNSN